MGDIGKDINSTFKSLKLKALINIKYTANWISSRENEFFRCYELSPQQYNILRILRGASKPIKVQTIKDRMIERAPNATRLMDKLHDKGLIERVRCPHDRRVVFINITTTGLGLLSEIDHNGIPDLLKKLSEDEATLLSHLLDKLR